MALKPPAWCADATPTRRGWVDPRTGELLKAQRISDIDIMEWNGVPQQVVEQVVHQAPQMLHEAPVANKSLEDMNKTELLALAEQTGVDVSPYATKAVLIEQLS